MTAGQEQSEGATSTAGCRNDERPNEPPDRRRPGDVRRINEQQVAGGWRAVSPDVEPLNTPIPSTLMTVSSEGVALVSRVALVAVLIVVTAVMRTVVGPSKRRGFYMGLGTLGGIAAGIGGASLISRWTGRDVSVLLACLGIFAGWAVAWIFARRIPREAH